jgi:hypothetical protein
VGNVEDTNNSSNLSEFFSALSKEKKETRQKLEEKIANPESGLSNLFQQLEEVHRETKKVSSETSDNKKLSPDDQNKLEAFSSLMNSVDVSLQETQEKILDVIPEIIEPPITVEVFNNNSEKEGDKLEAFSQLFGELAKVDSTLLKVEEKQEPQKELVIEGEISDAVSALSGKLNLIPEDNNKPQIVAQETNDIITSVINNLSDMETKTQVKEEVDQIAAIKTEFKKFKTHIQQHISNQGFSGGGSGETRVEFLDDVDRDTAKVDGKALIYQASSGKWIGGNASGGSSAADDLTAGDAAVLLTTTSGNITIDAAANDSDIIFKGTDGGADTTFLTIDGSDAGTLIANHDLELGTDGSLIKFGADNEIALTHVHNTGLLLTDSGGSPTLQFHDTNESVSSDGSKLILTSGGTAFSLPTSDGSNGQALVTNGSGVFSFADAGGGSAAADDLTAGDAAVTLTTSSGNITIDAAANDTDIIFKGTDGGADITMLTLDGSDAGAATFNSTITTTGIIIGSTAVTSTATELNFLDGSTANSVVNSKAVIYGSSGELAGTLSTAAQTNVTSVGTLTALQIDNININLNTISSTAGTDLLITPVAGQQIVLDGTIVIDAGVVTGATSITSTAFVGDITGDVTGNADTATALATARTIGGTSFDGSANIAVGLATLATTVTITDNESTNENNAIIFTAGGDVDGGNLGLESDGTLTYNPSTGIVTATGFAGALTGNVTGNASGTAATVTGAAQTNITSLGTLTALTVDNVIINGATIGHTDDTDLMTVANGIVTVAGEVQMTTLDIGGTNVTSTAAELNKLDGATVVVAEINFLDLGSTAVGTAIASKAVILDSSKDYTGIRNLTVSGELDAATGDFSGAVDIAGDLTLSAGADGSLTFGSTSSVKFGDNNAASLVFEEADNAYMTFVTTNSSEAVKFDKALDINAAVQIDATFTSGIDGQGYDTKFFGDTASAFMIWDTSADDLIFSGGAGLIVPDGQFTLGSTAVTSTAAELNLLDTASANSVVNSKAVVYGSSGELAGVLSTAAQTNVTSLGTLTALTVDDVAVNGKAITMTGSSSDTAVFTAGTNGTLSIVTTDAALGSAAANITITADGTAELAGTTVTLNSSGGITLDADNGTVTFADAGSSLGTITSSGYSGTAAVATAVTITDNEATNEENVLVFVAGADADGGNVGLESDGDLKYNPSTGTLSVTNIIVSGTQTIVDSVTMNASNAVIFEGSAADDHETTLTSINATGDRTISLPNVSGTIPVLAVVSATAITSTPDELNILDGATVVVAEINALDLGSTAVGTAIASKAVILDSSKDYTGIRNLTISGEIDAATGDYSGAVDIAGATTTAAITASGIIKTDDSTAATSTTDGSLQTDGGLSVVLDAVIGDDLIMISDAAVLTMGADKDVTLTHVHDTGILLNSTNVIQFNDASQNIGAPSATVLDINATDEIELNATLVDVNANLDVSGTGVIAGAVTTAALTASGIIKTDDTTAATSTTDGSLQTDGGLSVAADAVIGDDLFLLSDAAVLTFGADKDVTLTHVHNAGVMFNAAMQLRFRDSAISIGSPADGDLDINADDEIELNSTLIDINGNVDISGTTLMTGVATHGGNVISDTDSTDDLGTTGVRWANLYVDAITATDQITATGFTGTLDGILGSGAAAAATTTTLASTTITASGIIKTDDTTAATSTTDGSLQTDGGLSVALDAVIGDDLFMLSDAAVITFGADKDVTLTHVADTGLLLNSTSVIQFNDASQNIGAPSATVLDINATDEIELNATLIDVNGNLDVSGTGVIAGAVSGSELIASNGLVVNSATVAASYSVPSGSNAMSVGPVSVATGQTVTIPTGSRWLIL